MGGATRMGTFWSNVIEQPNNIEHLTVAPKGSLNPFAKAFPKQGPSHPKQRRKNGYPLTFVQAVSTVSSANKLVVLTMIHMDTLGKRAHEADRLFHQLSFEALYFLPMIRAVSMVNLRTCPPTRTSSRLLIPGQQPQRISMAQESPMPYSCRIS